MSDVEPQDAFGTGLRAYLGRHSGEDAPGEAPPASDPAPEAEASGLPPGPETPEEQLAGREQELAERERQLREHIKAFEAHLGTLSRREQDLREREEAVAAQEAQASTERRNVREALREHAEGSLARIFQVFDDALAADHPAGGADHGVRLAAVRALLAEAYAKDGDGATAAVVDELAQIRERRTGS